MVKEEQGVKDKLGPEKYNEIIEKEWSTAEVPTEEELAGEEVKSPKTRNNVNSRKNLVQYRKDITPATKKKIVENLKFEHVEEDINPADVLDKSIDHEMLNKLLPINEILSSRQEQEIYWHTINLFMKDFDISELTSSDIDDIIVLARNKVLEFRLMKISKNNPKMLIEAGATLEKWQKHSEKVKTGLAARRVDRVDVKTKRGISIVDFAAAYDEDTRRAEQERHTKLIAEEEAYLKKKQDSDNGKK